MKQVILTQPVVLLNSLLEIDSNIEIIRQNLSCSETFTKDTLEDFFYKYEETSENKDPETLRVMLHDAQHYKIYLTAILDYIMKVNDQFTCLDEHLNKAFEILRDGEHCE